MYAFIGLAKEKGMADLASTVCATGGGAHKFEPDFKREVNMNLNKFDELDSLIRGVEFMVENSKFHELFYYDHPQVGVVVLEIVFQINICEYWSWILVILLETIFVFSNE